MILSDSKILECIQNKSIIIEPFDLQCLGSNSYDIHLGKTLGKYNTSKCSYIDSKEHNKVEYFDIPEEGIILYPEILYLGASSEYTETKIHVPFCEGKSSIGRLGINIHSTAGKGDVGFCGHWTLEISVVQPVRVYAGMKIGQLIYFNVDGEVKNNYKTKKDAKYNNTSDKPMESLMFKNF